jgi:myo-inositol catabolism protein IolC
MDLTALQNALLGLGPGGIVAAFCFYLYRDEKAERRELQNAFTKLLEATVASRHDLAAALEKIADKVGA